MSRRAIARPVPKQPRGRSTRRRTALGLALLTLLGSGAAQAAAFLPGQNEPDPPTGEAPPAAAMPEAPLASGNGIRWQFAPWRWRGQLALDLRWMSSADGRRQQQAVTSGDVEFASYLWQPWFVQMRVGMGLLASRGDASGGDGPGSRDGGFDLTGRLHLSVFPSSRFPFELRADVGDSRSAGDTLGTQFRSYRLSLSQSYQPPKSSDTYSINLDTSRLSGSNGIGDSLAVLRASSAHLWSQQAVETSFAYSRNARSDTDDATRNLLLSAHHSWNPGAALSTDTLASWNDSQLTLTNGGDRSTVGAALLQLSTVASWRPRPGDWLYSESAPLSMAATVRLSEASTRSSSSPSLRARTFSTAAGVAKELSPTWRVNGGFSFSRIEGGGGRSIDVSGASGALAWSPESVLLGEWRYAPSGSLNLAWNDAADGSRKNVGLQGAHNLSRSWPLGPTQSVSFNLSQAVGALHETPAGITSTGVSHAVGVFWQRSGEGNDQTVASLSLSDSRNRSQLRGAFQFANLQISQRQQVSRYSSWAANLTLQTSRSDAEQLDPFTGDRLRLDNGWQRYTSGSLSFDSARVFGVPRLRFTGQLTLNSQQLERRSVGDIDAPLERTTESLEARLDYTVGRLDLRLSARAARIEGRRFAGLTARLQRRF